ncbi:hypothetical protein JCM19236_2180 [Vibrio sp. JCM 19236]|nr:hypothetical protein JCM19236_2180 [Vibrio sp. JCM 19236]
MRNHDSALLAQFEAVKLGYPADVKLSKQELDLIKAGEQSGLERIKNAGFDDSRDVLGTRAQMTKVPSFQHAYGTLMGQWGLPAEHTMYAGDFFDADGEPLDGSKYDYVVTFEAPEINKGGFWSYTAYSAKTRLMEFNEMNRHSRGDRTLQPNPDGSYTIYMSSDTEGQEDNPNFLPIPNHAWYSILRMYTPGEDVRTDKWKATPFTKVKKS